MKFEFENPDLLEQSGKIVSERNNRQKMLKGIYEENLWVTGKRDDRVTRSNSKVALPTKTYTWPIAIVGVLVVFSIAIAGWIFPVVHNTSNSENNVANSAKDLSPNAAKNSDMASSEALVGPDRKDSQSMGNEVAGVPDSAPKQVAAMDRQDDMSSVPIDSNRLEPDQYQSLANTDIPLSKLFGLSINTIIIDPGHGGKDPGAVGKLGGYEKDVALAIGKELRDRLKKHKKLNVLMTRETDETMSLSDRVDFANVNNADLFISIHVNTFPKDQKSFVETYYFGSTDDKAVAELAARENADSHFQFAEFKEMIQKIGDTLKFQESRQLAHAVQSNLYQHIRKINKHTRNHGIKSAPFVVLLGLDAPSILTEVSCFCNPDEEKRLKSARYREKIAAFLEQGIVTYLNRSTNVGGKWNGEKERLAKAQ